MARTFQNIRLFHNMTAVENVQVAMHSRLKGGVWASIFRTSRLKQEESEAEARASELLASAGSRAASTTSTGRTSPTATSGGSRSHGRSPPSRCSCSSTSRPPG